MNVWFVSFAVALGATLSATQFVRVTALRLRAVDTPGGRRVHRRPTARLGGLGVFWGFAGALLLVIYGRQEWKQMLAGGELELLGLIAAGGAMLLLGLVDDTRGLAPLVKLGGQIAAATLLWAAGWRVDAVALPGGIPWHTGVYSLPLTVGWVVFVTNAYNLIDGLDGLACGVALVACVALAFVLGPAEGFARLAVVALSGALLGFLWFNFNPALIFMGDSGSLFVGLVLAVATLRTGGATGAGFPTVAVLLLALPLADTVGAIVRRTLGAAREARRPHGFVRAAARRVLSADRGHIHHVLMRTGRSTRATVTLLWGVAATLAFAAWVYPAHPGPALTIAAVLAVAWGAGFDRVRRRVHAADAPPAVVHPAGLPAAEGIDAAA